MNILLILRNWSWYRHWLKRKKGKPTIEFEKGPGYYFTVGIIGINPIGRIETWDMKSGRKAIVKLIDYTLYRDPDDMIEKSYWQIIEYVGFKKPEDCTFKEFLDIYVGKK